MPYSSIHGVHTRLSCGWKEREFLTEFPLEISNHALHIQTEEDDEQLEDTGG
jgi:hypothetical protein